MENLIETTGLCKRYEDFSLEGVNLTVPAGTIVGLIGENGAGKTTTLKALLGMVHPTQGSARLLGKAPGDPEALAQVGVVFEDAYFYETMCAEQIDKVMAQVYSNWDGLLFREYCHRFELSKKQPLKEFSRGMRMKLSLATALAHRPRLLILDEATSSIDTRTEIKIGKAFDKLMKGKTSFIIAHRLSTIRETDIILVMDRGHIVESGSHDQLLKQGGYYARLWGSQFES